MGQIFRRYVRMWLHTGSTELWDPRNPQKCVRRLDVHPSSETGKMILVFFRDRDRVAVTRHMWAPPRFFLEMDCPDRSSGAKSRIAAGPQSANRVIFCDCDMKSSVKLPFYYLLVKGGRKHSRYGPFPPPPLLPPRSFPFFPGRLGSSAASRRFWAELGAPAAPRLLIFGEPISIFVGLKSS